MEMLIEQGIGFLTGPQGGTLAFGALLGWVACSNTLLKDTKERLKKVEQELAATRASFSEQIGELRSKYEEELRTPSVPAHMVPNVEQH